jgi:predicted anti-sigma-YlaC factor YlaD
MSEARPHVSPNLLVRLAMAKHSEDELRSAEEHARACPRCRAELDEVARARERFRAQVFPRTQAALAERGARRAPWPRLLPPLSLAAAVGAALAVVLVARPGRAPLLQAKGAGALSVYVLRDAQVSAVEDGARLRPGDRIRFAVQGAGAAFVLVASVDGRRQVTVYQPSTALGPDAGALTVLPDSIRLDDALGPERIFAVFSDRPVPEDVVSSALAALGAAGPEAVRRERRLALPFAQATVLVEKIEGP